MSAQDTKLEWARIVVLGLAVVALAVVVLVVARRHDRTLEQSGLKLQEQRAKIQRELQRQELVNGVIQRYLALPTTDWELRDQALVLVQQQARDKALIDWAAGRRKEIAPYLRRIRLVQRDHPAADRIAVTAVPEPPSPEAADSGAPVPGQAKQQPAPKGSAFADEGEAVARARKSPHWKTYIKTREQLRLKRGRYCCRITTGRELFSKANSVGECRGYAQLLCDHLAKTIEAKQQCFYALSTACVGGEIIGAG